MFRNFIKTAIRNILRHKAVTTIKIIGLSLAISIAIVIFSWIHHELSYDKFHDNDDCIYRLLINNESVTISPAFKKVLNEIPEITASTRLFNVGFLGEKTQVSHENKIFSNDEIFYADEEFFQLFSFSLISGEKDRIFKKNNAAVISESTAWKYFGDKNPIGQTLLLSGKREIEITGVLQNIPDNSHFHFDILINMKFHPWNVDGIGFGSAWVFPTYLKLVKSANPADVRVKVEKLLNRYSQNEKFEVKLQSLTDIHLHSKYWGELGTNGDIKYVYLFSTISLLILITAGINYVNLTTASSSGRVKEICIRKSIGASKKQLIFQLTGESIIITLIAFLLGLVIVEITKSGFSTFVDISIIHSVLFHFRFFVLAIFCTLLFGILTGLLPAFSISNISITNGIKSSDTYTGKKNRMKAMLVIFQLAISVILIISTLIISQQKRFIRNKNLGYNKDMIFVLHTGYDGVSNKIDVLKNLLIGNPDIQRITTSSQLPTQITTNEGINTTDGKRYETAFIDVDRDFFKTLNINILQGRDRIENIPYTGLNQNLFVVNQKFLSMIDVDLADYDKHSFMIRHGDMVPGRIVGVVQDFHFTSLHAPIQPLVFEFRSPKKEYLLIKINSDDIKRTIQFIETQWHKISDGLPFEYSFLDEEYEALYQSETQSGRLFFIFTLISILIIILGLVGLVSYIVVQKNKEVGIRKILGASVVSIINLITKPFIIWSVIANLFAWPVAYYFMRKWLDNFAYCIEISIVPFVMAGIITMTITIFAIINLTLKVATSNPVEALKYE